MNKEHYFLRPPIIISEEEVKRQKRDPKLLIEKFERLRRCELNSGKPEPLFGHRSGKNMNTHWLCFMKPEKEE